MDNRAQKGLLLKQVRESKGISLEAVHEATKIPMDALSAIEEGYTIRSLSHFYLRSFLKIYAQHLGVDVSKVVEDYQPEKLPPHINEKKEEITVEKLKPVLTPQAKDWIIRILIALLILFVLIKIVSFVIHKKSQKTTRADTASVRSGERKKTIKGKSETRSEKKKVTADKSATTAQNTAVSPPKAKNPSAEQDAEKIDLVVRAKKDNWLQVKVDGEIVFRSTLKKGAVENWH